MGNVHRTWVCSHIRRLKPTLFKKEGGGHVNTVMQGMNRKKSEAMASEHPNLHSEIQRSYLSLFTTFFLRVEENDDSGT